MPTDTMRFRDRSGAMSGFKRSAEDRHEFRSDIWVTVRDKDGNIKSESFQNNLRVNVGIDFWDTQLFSTSPGVNGANYIALTADSAAPLAGDTTLPSELSGNGLSRAQASHAHTSGVATTTFTHTWTYTTTGAVVIAKVGLFDASSSGHLVLETLLSSTATVNASGDTVTITWTINY